MPHNQLVPIYLFICLYLSSNLYFISLRGKPVGPYRQASVWVNAFLGLFGGQLRIWVCVFKQMNG